jgi:hypothetical protein
MKFLIAVYAAAFLLTFGYAYNADYEQPPNGFITVGELNTLRSLVCGAVWPLYWTVKGFKGFRPPELVAARSGDAQP